MARSDLVIDLVEAQQRGDENRFRMLVEAIIAEERSNQHHLVADRLSELITRSGARGLLTRDDSARHIADLVQEIVPKRRLVDVQMAAPVASAITEVVEEHRRSELLRSHGLEPRNRILLEGPPRERKDIAGRSGRRGVDGAFLCRPVRGRRVRFLGETTSRLDHVFEFARTRRCDLPEVYLLAIRGEWELQVGLTEPAEQNLCDSLRFLDGASAVAAARAAPD